METMQHMANEHIDSLSIFCLVAVNKQNPMMFIPLSYGYVFKKQKLDNGDIEFHWLGFRIILVKMQQNLNINSEEMRTLEFPPKAFKWTMSPEAFYGRRVFNNSTLLADHDVFRLIWVPPPDDDNIQANKIDSNILIPDIQVVT